MESSVLAVPGSMVPSLQGHWVKKHSSLMFQFIAELKQFEATLMKNNFLFSEQLWCMLTTRCTVFWGTYFNFGELQ